MAGKSLAVPIAVLAIAISSNAFGEPAAVIGSTIAGTERVLETVSVTATRYPTDSFDYPGMVTVIGNDDLKTFIPSSPDDVLKFVPNVEFTGGPRRSGEVPSIRGFSGPDLVILVDGARQDFGAGHDGRFYLDPSLLRQVEVLRGPASALYGSGGTGGVIEFRTASAQDFLREGKRYGANFSGGYQGVNDESLAVFTAYAMPTDDIDLLGSITKRDSGTIELGDGNELDNTDDNILSGLLKAGYRLGDHHRVEFSFRNFDNEAEEPNNGQGAGSPDAVEKDMLARDLRLAYRYADPANDWIDLDMVAYSTHYEADELRLDTLGAGPPGELLKRDVDTLGFRLDNRSRFELGDSVATVLNYGIEYYQDDQNGAADALDRNGVPDAETDFLGLFMQAEIDIERPLGVLPGHLVLLPGVRFDNYDTSSDLAAGNEDEQLSPRIGASYAPTVWSLAFVNYAEAFRAPTYDEIYPSGNHFVIPIAPGVDIVNRFVPNPDLKPQATETLEYGLGFNFDGVLTTDDTLRFKVARFHVDGKNFINLSVTQPAPFLDCFPFFPLGSCDGTTSSANVADAELKGTEIESSYENERLLFNLGYGHVHGEDAATGAALGSLAPDQLTLISALKLPEFDFMLGWRVLAAAQFDQVNDPDELRDGYVVNDLFFAWRPDTATLRGLRIDLGVDNIFDKDYERVFNDVVEPGRNLKALMSYSLNW